MRLEHQTCMTKILLTLLYSVVCPYALNEEIDTIDNFYLSKNDKAAESYLLLSLTFFCNYSNHNLIIFIYNVQLRSF